MTELSDKLDSEETCNALAGIRRPSVWTVPAVFRRYGSIPLDADRMRPSWGERSLCEIPAYGGLAELSSTTRRRLALVGMARQSIWTGAAPDDCRGEALQIRLPKSHEVCLSHLCPATGTRGSPPARQLETEAPRPRYAPLAEVGAAANEKWHPLPL